MKTIKEKPTINKINSQTGQLVATETFVVVNLESLLKLKRATYSGS